MSSNEELLTQSPFMGEKIAAQRVYLNDWPTITQPVHSRVGIEP